MAKKLTVEVDVQTNTQGTIAELKELKKQLKETAAGSDDFKRISKNIKEVEDSIEESRAGAKGFKDMLEEAPGPLGNLFKGLRQVEIATKGFGTALKATGIGLIVAAIGGLVAAFAKQEGAMKKLEPIMIGFEKILGGIFKAFEPLLDAFIEMAETALPYITQGIGAFYSVLLGLFTLVKDLGVGVGEILKGIFTLDFDSVTAGYDKIKNSIPAAMDAGVAAFGRYTDGTKELTKTEKENLKERGDAANKALEEKKKQMQAQDKLDLAILNKLKTEALALAKTDEEKLEIEKTFANKLYELKLKDLEDRLKLEKKGSVEFKNIQTEIIALQTEKLQKDKEFADKTIEIAKKLEEEKAKINSDNLKKAELDLGLEKEKGLINEREFQEALYNMRVKYANSNEELIRAEIDFVKFANEEKKKAAEEERNIQLNNIQSALEDLDRKNAQSELDFEEDLRRIGEQRELLAEGERIELSNEELSEFQKTEVRKKYSDQRRALNDLEVKTEKEAAIAKKEINLQYLGLFSQFGSLLQQVAGKNKALAISGVIIQQAASIGQIIANTGIANAKAVAATPLTGGLPFTAINTISAALSIASTIAAAVKSIQQINQAAASAGVPSTGGGGVGSIGTAPTFTGAPTAAIPQISGTAAANPSTQIAQTIRESSGRPIRAYVVANEISSQQSLDRRTNRAATFGLG